MVVLIIGSVFLYNYNLTSSYNYNDLEITTTIEPYEDEYYKFFVLMDINRKKEDPSSHIVYPVIDGLTGINFLNEPEFYSPSSIAAQWPLSEQIIEKQYPEVSRENLMGFSLPKEIGTYQLKFLLTTNDDFKKINDGSLYYVHIEKKMGKDLSNVYKYPIHVIE